MLKTTGSAILMATAVVVGLAAPAKADVMYDLTYYNGSTELGTGVLTLDLTSLSQAYNLDESLSGILVSVTANLDGLGSYTVTPGPTGNFDSGSIKTGPAGQIYSLTVEEDEPSADAVKKDPADILFLDLFTNSWQLHGMDNHTEDSGTLTVGSSPQLSIDAPAAVPEPFTLSLFGAGLAGAAALRRRRKKVLAS